MANFRITGPCSQDQIFQTRTIYQFIFIQVFNIVEITTLSVFSPLVPDILRSMKWVAAPSRVLFLSIYSSL